MDQCNLEMYQTDLQHLSDFFDGVAIKRLSSVETDKLSSNQHELNGVKELRALLGSEKSHIQGHFVFLGEEESDLLSQIAQLTWYDAREAHPTRSEYRLYFESNSVIDKASSGDLLLIGKRHDDSLLIVIAEEDSSAEQHLLWLFRQRSLGQEKFSLKDHREFKTIEVSFIERNILEQLGISTVSSQGELLDLILKTFGASFPDTRTFSRFARELVPDIDPVKNSDYALVRWLDQEEKMFRTLERHLLSEKLREGFNEDVDEFLSYSLGVQNRRKSRAGQAFENHIEQLFIDHGIHFNRGMTTENRSRPDFIFPGKEAYRDLHFPESALTMLAAKTTCKDRWRQVLAEAKRIKRKHLITLEPGISENQINEMSAQLVQLVIPTEVLDSYNTCHKELIMDVNQFLHEVGSTQNRYQSQLNLLL